MDEMIKTEVDFLIKEKANVLRKKLRLEYMDLMEVFHDSSDTLLEENLKHSLKKVFDTLEKELGIKF